MRRWEAKMNNLVYSLLIILSIVFSLVVWYSTTDYFYVGISIFALAIIIGTAESLTPNVQEVKKCQ